jgi:hypothetical protein
MLDLSNPAVWHVIGWPTVAVLLIAVSYMWYKFLGRR